MRLTNYWWLLIWLFAGGAFLLAAFPKQEELVCGKAEYRWMKLPAYLLMLPYLVWAMFRAWFGDTETYRKTFFDAPDTLGQLGAYLAEHDKDQGFSVLMILFKTFVSHSDVIFFGVIAAVQIWCMVTVFRKYSSHYWTSIFLFIVSTDYLSWMHNGMRQFLAVTIIFVGFKWMLEKRYVLLTLLILVASTIHGSALMMLPIVFIIQGRAMNKKTMVTLLAMLVVVLFIDRFTPMLSNFLADTQYNDMMGNEIWVGDDGTSIIRVLVYSVPALMAIIGKKYIDEANDPVINLCVNCSMITMGVYLIASVSSGIYIGRLPIYTTLMGYISLPWLVDHMFTERSAKIVNFMMVSCFLVFFYFQMHHTWALI